MNNQCFYEKSMFYCKFNMIYICYFYYTANTYRYIICIIIFSKWIKKKKVSNIYLFDISNKVYCYVSFLNNNNKFHFVPVMKCNCNFELLVLNHLARLIVCRSPMNTIKESFNSIWFDKRKIIYIFDCAQKIIVR